MSAVLRFIRRNPFLVYGSIGLILALVVWVANIEYDDAGVRGILYWVGSLFVLPFALIHEALRSLNEGRTVYGQNIIAVVGGLAICLILDVIWRRLISSKPR